MVCSRGNNDTGRSYPWRATVADWTETKVCSCPAEIDMGLDAGRTCPWSCVSAVLACIVLVTSLYRDGHAYLPKYKYLGRYTDIYIGYALIRTYLPMYGVDTDAVHVDELLPAERARTVDRCYLQVRICMCECVYGASP